MSFYIMSHSISSLQDISENGDIIFINKLCKIMNNNDSTLFITISNIDEFYIITNKLNKNIKGLFIDFNCSDKLFDETTKYLIIPNHIKFCELRLYVNEYTNNKIIINCNCITFSFLSHDAYDSSSCEIEIHSKKLKGYINYCNNSVTTIYSNNLRYVTHDYYHFKSICKITKYIKFYRQINIISNTMLYLNLL